MTSTTSSPNHTAPGTPLPVGQLLKVAAADSKTTNGLLLILVLCMSGMMPEQFTTICGL